MLYGICSYVWVCCMIMIYRRWFEGVTAVEQARALGYRTLPYSMTSSKVYGFMWVMRLMRLMHG